MFILFNVHIKCVILQTHIKYEIQWQKYFTLQYMHWGEESLIWDKASVISQV